MSCLIAEPISSAPFSTRKPLCRLTLGMCASSRSELEGRKRKDVLARHDPTHMRGRLTAYEIANSSGYRQRGDHRLGFAAQYRARDVSIAVTNSTASSVVGRRSRLPLWSRPCAFSTAPVGIRFDRALSDSSTIASAETTLEAPFSVPTTGGAPLIQWFLNGSTAQDGASTNTAASGEWARECLALSRRLLRRVYDGDCEHLSLLRSEAKH